MNGGCSLPRGTRLGVASSHRSLRKDVLEKIICLQELTPLRGDVGHLVCVSMRRCQGGGALHRAPQ